MTVDASSKGLGAVLSQLINGLEFTVAFASRTLSSSEANYSTIEREALACLWAVEKCKMYIWGSRFQLVTDHKPLMYMLGDSNSNKAPSRLVRLLARLQEFNFDFKYIPGGRNIRADCLSRITLENADTDDPSTDSDGDVVFTINDATLNSKLSEDERIECIKSDSCLERGNRFLVHGWPNDRSLSMQDRCFSQVAAELSIVNDILFRNDKYVPPEGLRSKIFPLPMKDI